MSVNLKDLVFYPETFFEEIEYQNKNLFFPFAFVAIIATIGIMDFLLFATHYTFDFSDVGFSSDSVIGLLVIPFITWALVTLVIFTFARAFSGDGSLPATFQNIGFGMFPLAIAAVVRLPGNDTVPGKQCPDDRYGLRCHRFMGIYDLVLVSLVLCYPAHARNFAGKGGSYCRDCCSSPVCIPVCPVPEMNERTI